jgi:threonine synthase
MIVCLVTGAGFKDPPSMEKMLSDAEVPTMDLVDLEARL